MSCRRYGGGLRHAQFHFDRSAQRVDAGIDVEELGVEPLARIRVRGGERLLSKLELREDLLVDLDHDLRLSGRREHHELLARLDDVAGLHVAPDQYAIGRRDDDVLRKPCLGNDESGLRLLERGLRHFESRLRRRSFAFAPARR